MEDRSFFVVAALSVLLAIGVVTCGKHLANSETTSWRRFLQTPKRGMIVRTIEGPERLQELLESLRNEPCWIMKITSDKMNFRHTVIAECREE
jgi:hypothetical protein